MNTTTTTAKTYYVSQTTGQVYCSECRKPYRLTGSINAGRWNQKNFKSYDGEIFTKITEIDGEHICESN